MSEAAETLASLVRQRFGSILSACRVAAGELTLELRPDNLIEVAQALRDEPEFGFDQLMDLCGVDYSQYGRGDWKTSESATNTGYSRGVANGAYSDRAREGVDFAVVYHLLSVRNNQRIRLRAALSTDPPRVPSVAEVWSAANWFEREAFDLFGILFEGHPDLRRILTDYGFVGHPFRKDFPLIGNVEMRYDPERQRVIYQPVSIEPRTLVPRVIRHDHRFLLEEERSNEPKDA